MNKKRSTFYLVYEYLSTPIFLSHHVLHTFFFLFLPFFPPQLHPQQKNKKNIKKKKPFFSSPSFLPSSSLSSTSFHLFLSSYNNKKIYISILLLPYCTISCIKNN